ncbi:MAG TPA: PD-(D/E)XK nuclease family protein [Dehalococcoidia bacterium]|nr:PD-(D/E)XK nuclease family protein [Dehalococcoidia bacterium]
MPDVKSMLQAIAGARRDDPLAPVTVIVPSHAAGLQMRRRLAGITPFAAVRFETLPRIAELLAAGHLAAAHRLPLARPIGDYVAEGVARESRGALKRVASLPGYARALRRIFRRIRRGGIHSSADVRLTGDRGHLDEVLRLYDLFRDQTAQFYDDEDLLEEAAAAVRSGRAGALPDLGAIYVTPPGALSAGGADLLAALRERAPSYQPVDDEPATPETRLVLAPDPASEAREVVREVLAALEGGAPLHEIAVFHGAGREYRRLLRDAFVPAAVPIVQLPGVPLSETPAGRGVLLMLSLPEEDYRQTTLLDFMSIAPLKDWLPGSAGPVRNMSTTWDKASREAGVTHGREVWRKRLDARLADLEAGMRGAEAEGRPDRTRAMKFEHDASTALLDVVTSLIERLERLRQPLPAAEFIDRAKEIIRDYFAPDAASLEEDAGGSSVMKEIDQLGTVASVGGSFDLAAFVFALRANLEAAFGRGANLGDGVIVADYRAAAGLRFQRVVLCGAFEGALPAGPGGDSIIADSVWSRLRENHPFIEDARLRIERAKEAAQRAVASASDKVTWSCPLYEPGGTREYYPSPMIVDAVSRLGWAGANASTIRSAPAHSWLRRTPSPLAAMLTGPTADPAEQQVRQAISAIRSATPLAPGHPSHLAVTLLRERRSQRFTEWDGNLSQLHDSAWLELQGAVSPTSLEHYSACGFRYLCRSLFKLNLVEEPEEREMMDPAARGSLIHNVLERFFTEARAQGRPGVGERWTPADRERLLAIADEELAQAGERGAAGHDVYSRHEARTIRADLERFLEADYEFRAETGAVPTRFEEGIPETDVAGVRLRGRVDRIDITPGGSRAWVIDYKTGSMREFKDKNDPLQGGRKLQLPVYLAAVPEAEEATALYWFMTQNGGFNREIIYEPTAGNQARFQRILEAIVQGIRAGAFPAVSGDEDEFYGGYKNCRFCDFERICSRRRDQEFELKSEDDAMGPWKAVAAAGAPTEAAE